MHNIHRIACSQAKLRIEEIAVHNKNRHSMIIFKLAINSQLLKYSYELPVRVIFYAQNPNDTMSSQPMSRILRLLKLHGDHVRLYMPFYKPTDLF
jgi:hypothetical protein